MAECGRSWPAPLSSSESMPVTPAGICANCVHQKLIRSGRGSEFSMCLRHREDGAYPKYPPLPVLGCPGHQPRAHDGDRPPRGDS